MAQGCQPVTVAALGCAHSRGGQTGSRGKHGGQEGGGSHSRRRPAPGIQGRSSKGVLRRSGPPLGSWLWASHRPLMCLGFPSCRTMETRQPALGQPLRTPKDPTGLPHLWRGSRNILQPVRALGRPGLGAEGLSSPCCPRTWLPPLVFLLPHYPYRWPWPQEHTWGALGDALAPGRHPPAGAAGSGRFILGPAPPATLAPKTPRAAQQR